MPQTATQKNRPSLSRPEAPPQPLSDSEPAETADHEYALVSVLYHALQGAQACDQYIADAERAGDEELIEFFEECRDEQKARATRAKQLLAGVMDVEEEEDDEDEDDSEEDSEDEDEER